MTLGGAPLGVADRAPAVSRGRHDRSYGPPSAPRSAVRRSPIALNGATKPNTRHDVDDDPFSNGRLTMAEHPGELPRRQANLNTGGHGWNGDSQGVQVIALNDEHVHVEEVDQPYRVPLELRDRPKKRQTVLGILPLERRMERSDVT